MPIAGIIAMKESAMATTLKSALEETEEIIFSVVEGLLAKTGITAKEVHLTKSRSSFHSSFIDI